MGDQENVVLKENRLMFLWSLMMLVRSIFPIRVKCLRAQTTDKFLGRRKEMEADVISYYK